MEFFKSHAVGKDDINVKLNFLALILRSIINLTHLYKLRHRKKALKLFKKFISQEQLRPQMTLRFMIRKMKYMKIVITNFPKKFIYDLFFNFV